MALFGSCYGERWSSVFFFLGLFFCLSFTVRGVLFYGISVYSVVYQFFFCFFLFFLPSEARRHFFLECGRWDSLGSGEKNFYLIFFGLLLFIVVLGTFDPSRVRLFGNIHVVLVLTYMFFMYVATKRKALYLKKKKPPPLIKEKLFLVGHLTCFSHRAPQGKVVAPPSASTP